MIIQSLTWDSSGRARQLASPHGNGRAVEQDIEYIEYIGNNLTEELTPERVSSAVSFSPIYFHNHFRRATGMTLRDYVEERRGRKAINLPVGTEMTLAEIAYERGFSSQSYFSFVFRKENGRDAEMLRGEFLRQAEGG